jgi:cytoskeleton protein RodZ
MASVGAYLRDLRARRGVSLDELARTTRVAPRYLEALERDALADLPAPVFIRGFIRAYCQALGESPDEALACYDGRDPRAPRPAARVVPAARPGRGEPRARSAIVVSFALMVILGVALFTVALVMRPDRPGERAVETWPDRRSVPPATVPPAPIPGASATTPASPTPVVSDPPPPSGRPPAAAAPSATATRPVVPGPPAAGQAAAPEATAPPVARATAPAPTAPALEALVGSVSAPYRLVARAREPTWLRVRTEDGRTIEETVPAGEIREWVSNRPFVLTVGNAGGVSLELNGRTLPPLGPHGFVVHRLVLPPDVR